MKKISIFFLSFCYTSVVAQDNPNYSQPDSTIVQEERTSETERVAEDKDSQESHEYKTYNKAPKRQEIQTLSGSLHHSGGYGALIFKSSKFKDETIILAGIRGAWVLNRAFGIGFEANGILPISKFEGIDPEGENKAILLGGYGGFFVEPILWSNKAIHIAFPISAGSGWLGYIEDWDDNTYTYNYEDNLYGEDVFWYVEPGAVLEFNVSRSFRIDLGVSKRFTQNLELIGTEHLDFENINYMFAMKFGGF